MTHHTSDASPSMIAADPNMGHRLKSAPKKNTEISPSAISHTVDSAADTTMNQEETSTLTPQLRMV